MSSSEGFTDRATALYYEIQTQLNQYLPDRFRRFYFTFVLPKPESRYLAEALGVDVAIAEYRGTIETCALEARVFATPGDILLTPEQMLTQSSMEALERVAPVLRRLSQLADTSELPPLKPHRKLTRRVLTLYIGRRSLGPAVYNGFSTRALRFLGLPADENSVLRFEVRSFDSIVDQALIQVLWPFPFNNQELLKTILKNCGPLISGYALSRLDRTPENAPFFEAHLTVDGPVESAAAGALDLGKLRSLHAQLAKSRWNQSFVETRIAVVENDVKRIEAIACSNEYFGAVFQAVEAIDDPATLERVAAKLTGDSPRDDGCRLIIAAKQAYRAGDRAKLQETIEASERYLGEVKHILVRMKLRLDAQQKVAPKVFVSYRHESATHRAWVLRLAEDLRRAGINVLLDQWELSLGDSVGDFGAAAIFNSQAMLFVITEASVAAVEAGETSRSVLKFEFQLANARRYRDGNFRIIGILRSGERPPNHLADTVYLDFRREEDYESHLPRLINDLRRDRPRPFAESTN